MCVGLLDFYALDIFVGILVAGCVCLMCLPLPLDHHLTQTASHPSTTAGITVHVDVTIWQGSSGCESTAQWFAGHLSRRRHRTVACRDANRSHHPCCLPSSARTAGRHHLSPAYLFPLCKVVTASASLFFLFFLMPLHIVVALWFCWKRSLW